jgi:hypothetical protein
MRETSDFEYSDGTPAPLSLKRFSWKHHQDHLIVQLIRAGAAVEALADQDQLPRIPGTAEQRDWDPEIPLFLDDLDEHGKAPMWHYTAEDRHITESMKAAGISKKLANKYHGESLEPITMFASYDPQAFVNDSTRTRDDGRPLWSRRRWNLNNDFSVYRPPRAKNTIPDE